MKRSEKSIVRIERIARYAASVNLHEDNPKDKPIFAGLKKLYKSDPKARKAAKRANDRAKYIASSYTLNGPGIFVDKYLRSFLIEYNGRLFQGNGDKQPNSFNVVNSFIEPDENALVLRLLPEEHYTFSLNKILELLTEPEAALSYPNLLSALEELKIHEYHILGGYSEMTFNDLDLTFHGVGFVRDHQELSIIGVFGKKVEKLETREFDEPPQYYPGKDFLKGMGPVDLSDIEIVEGSKGVPLITLSRLSLNDAQSQVRYVLLETKDTFNVITNDPSVLNDMKVMGMTEDAIKKSLEHLNEYLPILEFVEQLPLFQLRMG